MDCLAEFDNFGTVYKTEYAAALKSKWKLDIPLPDVSVAKDISMG